ncbi:TRAP transporter permease [Jeotgalibacillus marinus]|uniref:TRAP transporter permease n=1 Tax=Jeotgalibacillus marinus TaxID=86667 RepID=A0ABV3Q407_9BACL
MTTAEEPVRKINTIVEEQPSNAEILWQSRKEKWNKKRVFMLIISLLAIGMGVFHIYTAGFGTLESWQQRAIHVLWALLLIFLIFPFRKGKSFGYIDILFIGLTIVTGWYMLTDVEGIQMRQGNVSDLDMIYGTILLALVLEATRRTNGLLMSLIGLFFLVYIFFGSYFPGILAHPGARYGKMIDQMFNSTLGIFSTPIYISSTILILFVIFGSFLMKSGGGQFFTNFSFGALGNKAGGPALSAIGASALVSTITGNGAANAAITGSFTIPLMKKMGYSKKFAAAVEAVASQGGQIMPPIMGASVFIMAEATGVPFIKLALYALIPAIVYFLIAGFIVYFHSKKLELSGIPKEFLPNPWESLIKQGYLFLPIPIIIGLMVMGYSPMKAGFYAIFITIALSWIRKATRMNLLRILGAIEDGVRGALTVIAACATAGIIVGAVSLTGLGMNFSRFMIGVADGKTFLLLVMIAISSIILGMGMPTVSAYVILSVLGVPALVAADINLISAHMFVFYFGVLSGLTPPVAITAYTTAGIAGSNPNATALYAMKIGVGGFLVPFIFAYNPELLLQSENISAVILVIVSALISCYIFASAVENYLINRLNIIQRLLLFIAAAALIIPGLLTDLAGIVLFIVVYMWQKKEFTGKAEVIQRADAQ